MFFDADNDLQPSRILASFIALHLRQHEAEIVNLRLVYPDPLAPSTSELAPIKIIPLLRGPGVDLKGMLGDALPTESHSAYVRESLQAPNQAWEVGGIIIISFNFTPEGMSTLGYSLRSGNDSAKGFDAASPDENIANEACR